MFKMNIFQSVLVVSEDSVYLASEAEREEYVLSQDGLIYRGIPKRITVLPWTFGQVLHLKTSL